MTISNIWMSHWFICPGTKWNQFTFFTSTCYLVRFPRLIVVGWRGGWVMWLQPRAQPFVTFFGRFFLLVQLWLFSKSHLIWTTFHALSFSICRRYKLFFDAHNWISFFPLVQDYSIFDNVFQDAFQYRSHNLSNRQIYGIISKCWI